jgi:hypothetical protein
MSLDLSKLNNANFDGQKTIAECPACAAKGQDATGDHLVVYPDGRYGCVVNPKDRAHNQEIFRLAGGTEACRGPARMRIKRPSCATAKPRRLMVLDWLAPATQESAEREQPPTAEQTQRTAEGSEQVQPKEGESTTETMMPSKNPFGCRVPSMHLEYAN